MATTEIVYKNRNNANIVAFYEDNAAMDFGAVTRVVLKLYNKNLVQQHSEDSNTSPTLISWATNQITFNLNTVILDNTRYLAEVIIYDPSHTNGQVIAHPRSPHDRLTFEFVHG